MTDSKRKSQGVKNCPRSRGKQKVTTENWSLEQDCSRRKSKLQPDSTGKAETQKLFIREYRPANCVFLNQQAADSGLANLHSFVLSLREFSSFIPASIYSTYCCLLIQNAGYLLLPRSAALRPNSLSLSPSSSFFSFFPPPSLLSFFLCVSLTLLFPLIQEFHPPLCSSLTYNITIFQPPKTICFLGSVSLCLIFFLRWFPNSHLYFKILKIHVQQLSSKITKRVNCFFSSALPFCSGG